MADERLRDFFMFSKRCRRVFGIIFLLFFIHSLFFMSSAVKLAFFSGLSAVAVDV